MRADLSTVQQTLTPEAASVLNQSIAEAARRNHGQTTPLHVAATLLASPSNFLRQACIKSHPNSSHPLQCRALELCFSVALERLPTATAALPSQEPPVSNALMAALKRAQAHQRRGCPEQQQQPLLAVKVELEQLIVSILDDPSVSRVMREASFSSPAVKAAIEQSLTNSSSSGSTAYPVNPSAVGFGFRHVPGPINRNLYLNPRLQQRSAAQSGQQRTEDVKRVVDIMGRTRKRNPVLVGESEPQILVREILGKIEKGEFSDGPLRNSKVIRLEKELGSENAQMVTKVREISGLVESRIGNSDLGSIILDLGDLKWLVENQQPTNGGGAVAEIRKLLERFRGRFCLIGTATCETYLRCQVYYPSMENDLDLQAIPIAAKSPPPGIFHRLGSNNAVLLSSQMESISPARSLQIPSKGTVPPKSLYETSDSERRMTCCPLCLNNYRNDLAASFSEGKPENDRRLQLPQWMQNAKSSDTDSKISDVKLMKGQDMAELQKRWNETCLRLHPDYRQENMVSENFFSRSLSQQRSQTFKDPSEKTLQPNSVSAGSPPGESPVRTDLVLGRPNGVPSTPEKTEEEHGLDIRQGENLGNGDSFDDIDLFKKLLKGLAEAVWWQHDAASAIAATVTQCRLGNGKQRRGVSSKGDIWLLFTGPDRVGKRKMASALSDVVSGGNLTIINHDSRNCDVSLRGKSALDRITEAAKRNPFAVIVIEDIDESDTLLRSNIKRAMGSGRICDSYGREVSLGNVIFIVTANWSPVDIDNLSEKFIPIDETKLNNLVSNGWQLRLSVCEKTPKRRPSWLYNDEQERPRRQRKEILFDLNEAAEVDDDKANGSSTNSSGVSIEHDQEDNSGLINKLFSPPQTNSSIHRELVSLADDAIFFRPVDFGPIKRKTADFLKKRLSSFFDNGSTLEIKEDALERIAGATLLSWFSFEDWIEKTMVPSLNQMRSRAPFKLRDEQSFLRLELDEDASDRSTTGSHLPSSIRLVVD